MVMDAMRCHNAEEGTKRQKSSSKWKILLYEKNLSGENVWTLSDIGMLKSLVSFSSSYIREKYLKPFLNDINV